MDSHDRDIRAWAGGGEPTVLPEALRQVEGLFRTGVLTGYERDTRFAAVMVAALDGGTGRDQVAAWCAALGGDDGLYLELGRAVAGRAGGPSLLEQLHAPLLVAYTDDDAGGVEVSCFTGPGARAGGAADRVLAAVRRWAGGAEDLGVREGLHHLGQPASGRDTDRAAVVALQRSGLVSRPAVVVGLDGGGRAVDACRDDVRDEHVTGGL